MKWWKESFYSFFWSYTFAPTLSIVSCSNFFEPDTWRGRGTVLYLTDVPNGLPHKFNFNSRLQNLLTWPRSWEWSSEHIANDFINIYLLWLSSSHPILFYLAKRDNTWIKEQRNFHSPYRNLPSLHSLIISFSTFNCNCPCLDVCDITLKMTHTNHIHFSVTWKPILTY